MTDFVVADTAILFTSMFHAKQSNTNSFSTLIVEIAQVERLKLFVFLQKLLMLTIDLSTS
jgi:hypothetical protein